ncbi:hypothetical protein L208DRAFT_1217976, partial [Tricholoma matsutake]
SCMYDAVVSVLYNIWLDDMALQILQFKDLNNQYLGQIAVSFSQILEEVHDYIQCWLQRVNPVIFPWSRYTGIQSILDLLFSMNCPIMSSSSHCPDNHVVDRANVLTSSCQIILLCECSTIQDDHYVVCALHCHVCSEHLMRQYVFEESPRMIAFDMWQHQTSLLESIVIATVDGQNTTYKVRRVMYHMEDHFTSRFITETGSVWYHDGMSTGHRMEHEGNI